MTNPCSTKPATRKTNFLAVHGLLIAYFLGAVALCGSEIQSAPIPAGVDVARAMALIKTWEDQQPERATRQLRVIYWTPADREPAPGYRERLTRVMLYTQEFYASQMASYGLGRKTVNLELEADGLLKLRVVKGVNPFLFYRRESGQDIRKDCVAELAKEGISSDDETLVIFCNLAIWDAEKRTMRQSSPYYASGDHRKGTAWQVDSPLLDPQLLSEKTAMLQDGEYGKISVGRYNSIFVGGVVHELGHALGLPHCAESPEEKATRGTALMGSGNRSMGEDVRGEGRGTFLSFGDALRLLSHVQFSGSVKAMHELAEVTWKDIAVRTNEQGAAIISGKIAGKTPVYAVIGYADPTGGSNYDAQIGATVPAADGTFHVVVSAPVANKGPTGEFRLVACCVNGAKTADAGENSKPAFPYAFSKGRFDVTPATSYLGLMSALDAARSSPLTESVRVVLDPRSRDIVKRLLEPTKDKDKPEPAEIPSATQAIPLSDTRPLSASTGWGGVHYDRQPPQDPMMSGGQLYTHGIYAHAESKHVYRLGAGWARLRGHGGIADNGYGPVEFVIRGDGKELWRSGVVKPGEPVAFNVEVTGIMQMELLTLLTPAGASGAWGLWLEPLLER